MWTCKYCNSINSEHAGCCFHCNSPKQKRSEIKVIRSKVILMGKYKHGFSNYMKCNTCDKLFNKACLSEVLEHEHYLIKNTLEKKEDNNE